MRPLALLALLLAPAAAAQPFSTLEVVVSGAAAAGGAPFSDFWSPGPGLELRAEMPFYLGDVFVGGYAAPHRAAEASVPEYLALFPFAGWGYVMEAPGGLRLTPGLRTGLFAMWFDTDEPSSVRREAEIAAGFDLRLSLPVAHGWRLSAGAAYVRVYTYERLDLRFAQLGLSRTFGVPDWLQEILR